MYWGTCKAGPNSEHNGGHSQERAVNCHLFRVPPNKRRRTDAEEPVSSTSAAGRSLFVIAPAAFGALSKNKPGKPPVNPGTHLALLGDVLTCENPDKFDRLPTGIRGRRPHPPLWG